MDSLQRQSTTSLYARGRQTAPRTTLLKPKLRLILLRDLQISLSKLKTPRHFHFRGVKHHRAFERQDLIAHLRLPIIDGNSYTVNEDCSNLQDLIVTAAAIEGPLNHEIIIPASADCSHIGVVNEYHAWVLPSRSESSTGEIVIRTSDVDQLPPQGTRVTPEYRAHMPTIRANAWGLGDLYSTECIVGNTVSSLFTANLTTRQASIGGRSWTSTTEIGV